jgi:hypothetical protein
MTIYRFTELSDLKKVIKEDSDNFSISANRFPIRFIFLNSHEELKDVVDLLFEDAKIVELNSFLYSDDGWLGVDQVIKEVKKLTDKSIIVPFSEFIRFLKDEDFTKILNALAEIENTNFRLYIPLVGLWDRFEDLFWKKYYRQDNWAPIWKLDGPIKSIKVYQVGFDFNNEIKTHKLKLISNTREWFDMWKYDGFDEVISLSKPLLSNFKYSLPDQTFTQDIINTPKEYLSKIFDMDIDYPYDLDEEEYWIKLLIDVSNKNKKNLSLRNIFAEKFNINNVSELNVEDYLQRFLDNIKVRYNQWLIKNTFIESRTFADSYLSHCFKSMKKLSNNNLARKIFLEIFNLEYSEPYLDERRLLLNDLSKSYFSFAENDFGEYFKKIENLTFKQQLSYLTTTTYTEKLKIFEIIQNNGLDNLVNDLKIIFPDLYYYLDWNLDLNEDMQPWILDYFKEYNKSKVLNAKSLRLNQLLNEKNHPDNFYNWYFNVQNSSNLENNEDNYVVWIDALGAEWLPLLNYYLNNFGKENNKRVKYKSINAVNLPSATEFNKIDSDRKISVLDEYIHKNHYNYPESLLKEMEYIMDIARDIVKIDSPRVSIVSDHGFSFLCTKEFGGYKKYSFDHSKHEGRYVSWENREDVSNEDFMSTISESIVHEEQKYVVPLRHISLYNTPSHEVHGGATPEEVLVPCIVLENDDNLIIDYEIYCLKNEINISMDLELPITISPEPATLPVVICNYESLPISKVNNQYIIKLNSDLNKGTQNITIKIDDEEVKDLEINIKKGGMEEEDYGNLFG